MITNGSLVNTYCYLKDIGLMSKPSRDSMWRKIRGKYSISPALIQIDPKLSSKRLVLHYINSLEQVQEGNNQSDITVTLYTSTILRKIKDGPYPTKQYAERVARPTNV